MKFDDNDRADTSEVEDRRGGGFSGRGVGFGVGGLGIVGTLVVIAFRLLSGDDPVGNNSEPAPPASASSATAHTLGGSCRGVDSGNDPAKFIVCVETSVQSFWAHEFAESGKHYAQSKLVLFSDQTESSCGVASAETGPFYCPPDKKVYLDLGFFHELQTRFHARGGDFAEAYVVAHEYGHHVQDLLGIEAKFREAQKAEPSRKNVLSVDLELQADCYAGVWGHSAYEKGKVSSSEIAEALDAAASVGDDRIQKESRGSVRPETFTHGSAAARQHWFKSGMDSGDVGACDTFGADLQ